MFDSDGLTPTQSAEGSPSEEENQQGLTFAFPPSRNPLKTKCLRSHWNGSRGAQLGNLCDKAHVPNIDFAILSLRAMNASECDRFTPRE